MIVFLKTLRRIREKLPVKAPLKMKVEDHHYCYGAKKYHICDGGLVKHNARDAMDVYDPNTGAYQGRVNRKSYG